MFTKDEKNFLLEILDQVSVRGIEAKTMVVVIMGKLADSSNIPSESAQEGSTIKPNEEDTDIPSSDVDAS